MQLIVVSIIFLLALPAYAQQVGTMDYNNASNRFRFYNGSSWVLMGGGLLSLSLGSCSKPAAIEYDLFLNAMKYCNGSNWKTFEINLTLNGCPRRGEWRYNNGTSHYEYCNGLLWIRMS